MSNTPMSTFRMDVTLATPAIIQGHLTLESLLAAEVYERTGLMRDQALAQVPIASIGLADERLWLASSAFLQGGVRADKTTIIRRRTRDEMGPNFYEPNTRARKDPYAVEQGKGDFKALLNTYPTVEAEHLVWYFQGDAQRCVEMIQSLAFIGKRRGQGFGEIGAVTVRAVQESPLVDSDGIVRRPIPVRLLGLVDGAAPQEQQEVRLAVARHPLFAHQPEMCAIPSSNVLKIDESDQAIKVNGEVYFE